MPDYNFMSTPREIILLNPSNEDVKLFYDGEMRIIPSANRVVYKHPKYDDVCRSMQLADGTWVPGTLVLKDVFGVDEHGEEKQVWSAGNAVLNCLGLDPKTGKASSKMSERGISLVPPEASLKEIKAIALDGRRRWQKFQLTQAYGMVAAIDEKNSNRQKLGMPQVPGGPEYAAAVATIEAFSEEVRAEVSAKFKAELAGTVTPVWDMETPPEVVPEDAKIAKLLEDPDIRALAEEMYAEKTKASEEAVAQP